MNDSISIPLPAYLARVLVFLYRHRQRTSHLMPEVQGWVTKHQLAAEIDQRTDYAVSPGSVGTYLARLTKLVEDVVGARVELFEFRRNQGARLHLGFHLDVVDGTQQDLVPQGEPRWQLYFPTGIDRAAILVGPRRKLPPLHDAPG